MKSAEATTITRARTPDQTTEQTCKLNTRQTAKRNARRPASKKLNNDRESIAGAGAVRAPATRTRTAGSTHTIADIMYLTYGSQSPMSYC